MKPWNVIDKLVWKFMRWACQLMVRPLIKLGVTPNQVTVVGSVVNFVLAAFCFIQGTYFWNLLGLLFLLLHSYFDFVDGTLARTIGQASKLGRWLDPKFDVLGVEITLLSLVIGLIRADQSFHWVLISALAVFGHIGNLVIVSEYNQTIYQDSSEDFIRAVSQEKNMNWGNKLVKEFLTLRSFPFLFLGTIRYFLVFMIIIDQVKYFLLITAIFSNLRWLVMFWAYAVAIGEEEPHFRVIKILRQFVKK